MRHGKAENGAISTVDIERSLTSKGKDVSRQMAKKLREKIKDPGILVSSPAFRALETALILASEYGINPEKIKISSDIYYRFNEKTLLNILKGIPEDVDTVTLFGHNPSFTTLPDYFSIEPCNDVPKSGVVSLSFSTRTWSGIKPGTGKPELVYRPKQIL